MKVVMLLVLLASVVAILAAPSPPTWPKGFSATVLLQNVSGNYPPTVLRWFNDVGANAARFDGLYYYDPQLPPLVVSEYLIGAEQREYLVIYESTSITCAIHPFNGAIINPDWSAFTYEGQAIISSIITNQWRARNATAFEDYFEDASSREPVRINLFYRQNNVVEEERWTFREFDAGTQDPSIFVLNPAIKAICSPVSGIPIRRPSESIASKFQFN